MSNIKLTHISHGAIHNFKTDEYPTVVSGFLQGHLSLNVGQTHYGFIQSGSAILKTDYGDYSISAGQYFSVPSALKIVGLDNATGFVVSRIGYKGFFSIGGKIEKMGRLRYIDGCTDSVLISPPVLGDPCLNMLYIPENVDQTAHTHPSLRIGIITDGFGICKTLDAQFNLEPGKIFVLPTNEIHSFHTADSHLQIVVYHPDTDTGPSVDNHPMVNRTYVDGVQANSISHIRTKKV